MAFITHLISQEDVEPLATQVAGHIFIEGKTSSGILKHKDGYILKLPKNTQQAKTEEEFYKTLPSAPYSDLQLFIPKFYGVSRININGNCSDVLMLEDLVRKLEKPCVMDVKIGKKTWDPFATPEKVESEKRKYSECKRNLSFCIPGFQVYSLQNDKLLKFGKDFGKALNKETVLQAFSTFLNFEASENAAKRIIQYYIIELEKILNILSVQTTLHLFSSSILLTYDGTKFHCMEPVASWCGVHMIDFAHAISSVSSGRDENYLEGVASLINVFKNLERAGANLKNPDDGQ